MATALLVIAAAAPVAADSGVLGLVSGTYGRGLRLRAEPGLGQGILAVLPEGAELSISGEPVAVGGLEWRQVTYGDSTGWVAASYVQTATPAPVSQPDGQQAAESTAVPAGQPTPPPEATPIPTDGAAAQEDRAAASGRGGRHDSAAAGAIVEQALALVGRPYSMGSAGPYAFDCAGLVRYVYLMQGIEMERDAAGQWAQGIPIDRSELQPGDLVFFQNTYIWGISHVGIYVGNNRFVHAVDEWTGVAISGLDEGYWPTHYAGARRILP